jgi:hypothetical protein
MQRNIFHISKHIFLSVQVFSSGLRLPLSLIAGVITHIDHKVVLFLPCSSRFNGVDHGKLDFVHGPVQGIEW